LIRPERPVLPVSFPFSGRARLLLYLFVFRMELTSVAASSMLIIWRHSDSESFLYVLRYRFIKVGTGFEEISCSSGNLLQDNRRVSILVFMELALEDHHTQSSFCRICCFNPCFYGSCSRSRCNRRSRPGGLQFQSLFLWILLSKII